MYHYLLVTILCIHTISTLISAFHISTSSLSYSICQEQQPYYVIPSNTNTGTQLRITTPSNIQCQQQRKIQPYSYFVTQLLGSSTEDSSTVESPEIVIQIEDLC